MRRKFVIIDSCTVCPHEGTDLTSLNMICTMITPYRQIGIEIPEWCPLVDADIAMLAKDWHDLAVRYHEHGEHASADAFEECAETITRKFS